MDQFNIVRHSDSLNAESRELVLKATAAAEQAYAPYSGFRVGAALLLDDGSVISGSNQENAAYPSGMCAERVALYAAASSGRQNRILKLAVVAQTGTARALVPATPCGQCRQVMLEFEIRQAKPFQVIMKAGEEEWVEAPSAASLLPFSFSKETLAREAKG